MNTREHSELKLRGNKDVSYLGYSIDQMIIDFMKEQDIPGLTLAIVQAPYIPRVVGYGLSDVKEKRLASVNTMWPVGDISQAFCAVAIMQLFEDGLLDLNESIKKYIDDIPEAWEAIKVIDLLHHASGLPDYHESMEFKAIIDLLKAEPLHFQPGETVEKVATNFLLLSEIVERVSHQSYHDFVMDRQIYYLNLKHTGFYEDLNQFYHEDISKTEFVHQLFKKDGNYVDPTEIAKSYDKDGEEIDIQKITSLRGYHDIWASAQDISFWDIGLAGGILIHELENRQKVYKAWHLPNGKEVPGVAGWQFYKHRGLMDIKGSIEGYSSFLSRFTDPQELVCVTLLANKENIDFTNLGRKIAAAFGDLLSTNYDDNQLYLMEGQFSVEETVKRLEQELQKREIPLFAKFDHAKNAKQVHMQLRPTTVLVFGSPQVGTNLMIEDQSIALALPLKIAVWEDENGCTWLAFEKTVKMAEHYGLSEHPIIIKMQKLLEDIVYVAANLYERG
ncbi:serine hydrolase [Longibaculum muris]|uniref:serine hydrolase n=1 Tax=Longibaculum muris TaxID=1796628 RepID=UPI00189E0A76|nr:serine hydrolase [Longibaculum muris]